MTKEQLNTLDWQTFSKITDDIIAHKTWGKVITEKMIDKEYHALYHELMFADTPVLPEGKINAYHEVADVFDVALEIADEARSEDDINLFTNGELDEDTIYFTWLGKACFDKEIVRLNHHHQKFNHFLTNAILVKWNLNSNKNPVLAQSPLYGSYHQLLHTERGKELLLDTIFNTMFDTDPKTHMISLNQKFYDNLDYDIHHSVFHNIVNHLDTIAFKLDIDKKWKNKVDEILMQEVDINKYLNKPNQKSKSR